METTAATKMTKEEYAFKLKALNDEFNAKKKELAEQYALSNSPYQINNYFTDHIGTIRVERIEVEKTFNSSFPSCRYFGVELKKDLTNKKGDPKRHAWQENEEKKLNH